MRRQLFWWEIAGFLFVSVFGVMLHYLYGWTGKSTVAAAFSAVNESTWEHMKLLFVPLFVFSLVQLCFLGRHYPNFLAVRTVSALVGLTLIPIIFYTYSGVLGRTVYWVDISIFFISLLASFLLDFSLLKKGRLGEPWQQILGFFILWALAFCFVWCTYRSPEIGLWMDPRTGKYGL